MTYDDSPLGSKYDLLEKYKFDFDFYDNCFLVFIGFSVSKIDYNNPRNVYHYHPTFLCLVDDPETIGNYIVNEILIFIQSREENCYESNLTKTGSIQNFNNFFYSKDRRIDKAVRYFGDIFSIGSILYLPNLCDITNDYIELLNSYKAG